MAPGAVWEGPPEPLFGCGSRSQAVVVVGEGGLGPLFLQKGSWRVSPGSHLSLTCPLCLAQVVRELWGCGCEHERLELGPRTLVTGAAGAKLRASGLGSGFGGLTRQ